MNELVKVLSCIITSNNDIKIVEEIMAEFSLNNSVVREITSKSLMNKFGLSAPKINVFKRKLVTCGFMKPVKKNTYMLNPKIYTPKLISKRVLKKKWNKINID